MKKYACTLLAALATPVFPAAAQTPFVASYEVFIDGKPRLETRISFQQQGDAWVMTSESTGTRGLPRLLNASSSESSSGTMMGQHFRPDRFNHRSSLAGHGEEWEANFDWEHDQVDTRHEEGNSTFAVTGSESDPLSATMMIRENLAQSLEQFTLHVVDEDEMDQHQYRTGMPENLTTAIGCLSTMPVERVRENSKRYSTGWYAKSLQFLPVRVVHGKRGGKEFEMKITRLSLNGEEVSGVNDCAF